MADTLKEAVDSHSTPFVRMISVVMHFDDALTPPSLVFTWHDKTLTIGRGESDGSVRP